MMRNFLIITILISLLSCKAQNVTIVPLNVGDTPTIHDVQPPYYEKDVDHDFDSYVGTWQWSNGSSSITLQLIKIEMVNMPTEPLVYSDHLIGEYQFIENGEERVNSLPVTYTGTEDPYSYSVNLGIISTVNRGCPPCLTCPSNVRFLKGYFSDPTKIDTVTNEPLSARLCMVYTVDNGVEKLHVYIGDAFVMGASADYTGPWDLSITAGRYTFIKQ